MLYELFLSFSIVDRAYPHSKWLQSLSLQAFRPLQNKSPTSRRSRGFVPSSIKLVIRPPDLSLESPISFQNSTWIYTFQY